MAKLGGSKLSYTDERLSILSAGPGSGKTTSLVKDAAGWPEKSCIVTYTRDAAAELSRRGVTCPTGTVHSLTWPHVKHIAKLFKRGHRSTSAFKRRRIRNSCDPALNEWVRNAPSNFPEDIEIRQLMGWSPDQGRAPSWIWEREISAQQSYTVALARWLDKGAPRGDDPEALWDLDFLAVDEAQDTSALILSAAMALLGSEGKCLCVGDPGQAIFHEANGGNEDELPPAWQWATDHHVLSQGFRCGFPVADAAANILRTYTEVNPDDFRASHHTEIVTWNPSAIPMSGGMVLGHSRRSCENTIRAWGLQDVSVPPATRRDENELSISTIHAAKGTQSESVFVLPWSKNSMRKLRHRDASAVKLLYVAMTRASRKLHLPLEIFLELSW